MATTIRSSREKIEGVEPGQIEQAIKQVLATGATTFFVEKSSEEYLTVIYTDRGSAVIYTRSKPEYVALDASTEPAESSGRVTLIVDGEPTPLPANMKLGKEQSREIIEEFCASGQLSKAVYWVQDIPRSQGRVSEVQKVITPRARFPASISW